MTEGNDDSSRVLGPQGAARAGVGVLLGVLLGAGIALLTPRRRNDS